MILHSLYVEYCDLNIKLQRLCDLITAYGGSLPIENNSSKPQANPSIAAVAPAENTPEPNNITLAIDQYPKHGSWREKILHGLRNFGKPITAKELTAYILDAEESSDLKRTTQRTAQYLTFLDDEKRITVNKTNRPFRYSLIP